jgi:beta-glucosidase/6-phospho-beta-glucosidase/beta-galactosidase
MSGFCDSLFHIVQALLALTNLNVQVSISFKNTSLHPFVSLHTKVDASESKAIYLQSIFCDDFLEFQFPNCSSEVVDTITALPNTTSGEASIIIERRILFICFNLRN